jgi:valyl-tRNA synthetase
MSAELPKTYDPKSVEAEAYRVWTEEKSFHANPADPGDPYSIVIPPPNVTAALHLGHALNNTLQDILTRMHRMMGDNTEWIPGTDHAGIATQTVVEKRVLAEEGKRRTDFGRDEFVEKIQAWQDEYEARIIGQLKSMGCSCDWDRCAFTMDEPRARAVREAFFQLFKDGLIYRGKRLVNWDPATQTALADDEVEMEEIDGHFYYLRYPLVEEKQLSSDTGILPVQQTQHGQDAHATMKYVTVATTRPETMLGDTAVAINPKDPRAAQLRGRKILLPIVNREIPIIEDDYVVLPVNLGGDEKDPKAQFATGFLKVTPAHDPNDYEIGQRHKLDIINVMAPDASISDKHGWTDIGDAAFLLSKDRVEARKLVVDWFKKNGLLEEIKPYKHSVGHSYRSHVPIEPYLSDQWYCKVTDDRLRGAALRAIADDQYEGAPRDTGFQPVPAISSDEKSGSSISPHRQHRQDARVTGKLRFFPARYSKTFQSWHENIRDWCISRQLWWGHRIPVWSKEGQIAFTDESDNSWSYLDVVGNKSYVCLRQDDAKFINHLESDGWVRDPDVLDTWFSSGLWPMSTLGWPDESQISNLKSALNVWNPTSVLCTAREIITLWVSRMVMFNLYFLNRLPFSHVFIHAMIQDGHGQKMSKSLGNGVDPVDIIHSHGSDAMRFTLASMATNTQDVRMPVDMVDPHSGQAFTPEYVTDSAGHKVAAPIQTSPKDPKKKMVSSYGVASGKAQPTKEMPAARNTSSKFDLGRNFCNKLWNAARFAMMNLSQGSGDRGQGSDSLADQWIVSRFNRTVEESNKAIEQYRFDQYAKSVYDFVWRDFCDWYLEAIKPAMRDPKRAPHSAQVLAAVLDGSLRLLHPVIPFITETIWWKLNEIRPSRGLPGALECPASARLIKAEWPKAGAIDDNVETNFSKIQEIVGVIRNLRNDHKADPKKKVDVTISSTPDLARLLDANREVIELLATCQLQSGGTSSANATRATAAGTDVFVEGLIDPAAEAQRSGKRREELTKLIASLNGRLNNQGYIAKAPPKLVEETKTQLAEAEAELLKM